MKCCDRTMQEILNLPVNLTRDTCYRTIMRCPECKSVKTKLWREY